MKPVFNPGSPKPTGMLEDLDNSQRIMIIEALTYCAERWPNPNHCQDARLLAECLNSLQCNRLWVEVVP